MASRRVPKPKPKRVVSVPIPLPDLEHLIIMAQWAHPESMTPEKQASLELAKKRYEIYARIS